jgi:hypothetical protein
MARGEEERKRFFLAFARSLVVENLQQCGIADLVGPIDADHGEGLSSDGS